MRQNVTTALDNVDMTYDELIGVANDIIEDVAGDINRMMQSAYMDIENLSNDAIRELILRLSLRAYTFSEVKDKSMFKAALAETLRKEAHARNFAAAEGTAGAKENAAILNSSAEILADEIYGHVATMLKTKLDEIHRVVDSAKTVLMSRMTEAKLNSVEGSMGQ